MFTSLLWYQCPLPIGCFASARTSNYKVQLPMRKLKLTLHSNQVKGLSASRHATWFRHIFSAKLTVILSYNYLTSIKRQNLVPYTLKLCSRLTQTSIFSTNYRLQLSIGRFSPSAISFNDNAVVRNFYPEKFFAFFEAFQRSAANLKDICIWSPFTRTALDPSVTEPINLYTTDHFHSL